MEFLSGGSTSNCRRKLRWIVITDVVFAYSTAQNAFCCLVGAILNILCPRERRVFQSKLGVSSSNQCNLHHSPHTGHLEKKNKKKGTIFFGHGVFYIGTVRFVFNSSTFLTSVTIHFNSLFTRDTSLFIWQNTLFKHIRFHFNFLPLFFLLKKQTLPTFTARDTELSGSGAAHFYLASSRDLYRELINWLGCNETVSRDLTQGFTPSNNISTLCSPILFTLESFNLHVLYTALLISNRKEDNFLSFSFFGSSWCRPSSFRPCIKQSFWILHIRSERNPDHKWVALQKLENLELRFQTEICARIYTSDFKIGVQLFQTPVRIECDHHVCDLVLLSCAMK